MKTNVMFMLRMALAAVLLCGVVLGISACRETPAPIIEPVDNVPTTTRTTRTTVAVPEGQLTLIEVLMYSGETMHWSDFEPYTHEMTGDNTARFEVADTYGKECTLNVTVDFETGLLTQALLSYGDMTENVMTSDLSNVVSIWYEMEGITGS